MSMKKLNNFSRKEIKKIANYYATNPVTRSFFTEFYNISSSTFYSIIKKAIVEHIIDIDVVFKIQERAISNMEKKCDNINVNQVCLHYQSLLQKRNSFVFCKAKRKKIITEFANRDKKISKKYFCNDQCISLELLDKILIMSICYNEIPKKLYNKIKNDSLTHSNNSESVIKFFEELEITRNAISQGSNFDINELYYKFNKNLSKTTSCIDTNEYEQLSFLTVNENGEFIDDGYSILD